MKKIYLSIFILILNFSINAQDTIIIDQIIARVGDKIILQSDLEASYTQWMQAGNYASRQAKCGILEELIIQKLLLNQAEIDSIEITENELNQQIDSRLNMFINQFGSVAEMENFLNKSIFDIKRDLKRALESQIVADRMKNKITEDVTLTPAEVSNYYKKLNPDSIPLVDVSYEVRQILIYPKISPAEEKISYDKLDEIREKIVTEGKRFEAMARMYSDDEGSRRNGGELGFMNRIELDPAFASVAFSLQPDEVSPIVKSQFGYHIIQLIERKGDKINVRHILIKQFIPIEAKQKAIVTADSIRNLIVNNNISFINAAKQYSEDENSKNNGGYIFNQMTGSVKFLITELPPMTKYEIINLAEKEISEPMITLDDKGQDVIKIYMIQSKTPQHVANLKDDYQLIYDKALNKKNQDIFYDWVKEQQKNIYISIDKQYKDCNFKYIKYRNKN